MYSADKVKKKLDCVQLREFQAVLRDCIEFPVFFQRCLLIINFNLSPCRYYDYNSNYL
jgi:hypothetical protein